ncbi:hypothetical protein GCM10027062_18460 [Nocardioides hungaricus]
MPTLNIKDPDVYRLAQLLARRRGTSMTAVLRDVLAESEARDRPSEKATLDELMELARATAAVSTEPVLTDDDLYDERGLPR